MRGAPLPGAGRLALGVLAVWAVPLGLVVFVVPYHHWDELAYGEWSRLIAATGDFKFPSITPLTYQRPLLYVGQGWLWRLFGEHEVLGRLLAVGFLAMLAACVYRLGGLAGGPHTRRDNGALALLVLLSVTELAVAAGATLTDVPVAALVALTATLLWTAADRWLSNVGLLVAAAAAVLVKPTALPALAGLAAAHALWPSPESWRQRLRVAWIAAGALAGLAYFLFMAQEHPSLREFLQSAVLHGYYAELGRRVRLSQVVNVEWLGPWLCLPLLASLLYAAARVTDRRSRLTDLLPIAVGALCVAAWFAPAEGRSASLAAAIGKQGPAVIFFATIMAGGRAAGEDATSRRFVLRQVVWAAPALVSWAVYAPYETRLLASIWAPLVLLTTVPIAHGLRGWLRVAPRFGHVLLLGLALLAGSNARMIDGLDVRTTLTLARAAIVSRADAARIRGILNPDVEPVLDVLGPRIGPTDRIFSPEGRLRYYFPGRVAQGYPTRCEDLQGFRFFVLPTIPGVRDYFVHMGVSPEPAFWGACPQPRLERVPAEGTTVVFEIRDPRG